MGPPETDLGPWDSVFSQHLRGQEHGPRKGVELGPDTGSESPQCLSLTSREQPPNTPEWAEPLDLGQNCPPHSDSHSVSVY